MNRAKIAGLILAAGASSRMGRPKQLLTHGGVSLLRRAAETATDAGLDPIVAVLGAQPDLLAGELQGLPMRIVINAEWQRGMGSSIRSGIRAVSGEVVDAVVILLADQPFVTPSIVQRLVEVFLSTGCPIVASEYGGTRGAPALFDRTYLPRLADLADESGARGMIANAGSAVAGVPFPDGAHDIDTPDDYERLQAPGA